MKYTPHFTIVPHDKTFTIFSSNGHKVGKSEVYTNRKAMLNIAAKLTQPDYMDKLTATVMESVDKEFYWVLKARNSQVVLWSAETYKRAQYATKMAMKMKCAKITKVKVVK